MDQKAIVPCRRWYQVSLKSLFVGLLIVSLPLGWATEKFRRADRQRRVAKVIRDLGGNVEYDYEYDDYQNWSLTAGDGDQYSPPDPPGSSRIRDLLRDDDLYLGLMSQSVAKVYFWHSSTNMATGRETIYEVSDDHVLMLKNLPGLRVVELESQPISNAGARHLGSIKTLQQLNLCRTKITDDALTTIATLPMLEELNIGGTNVSAQALKELSSMSTLKHLSLSSDQITSVGGENLEKMFPSIEVIRYDLHEDGSLSIKTPAWP